MFGGGGLTPKAVDVAARESKRPAIHAAIEQPRRDIGGQRFPLSDRLSQSASVTRTR